MSLADFPEIVPVKLSESGSLAPEPTALAPRSPGTSRSVPVEVEDCLFPSSRCSIRSFCVFSVPLWLAAF